MSETLLITAAFISSTLSAVLGVGGMFVAVLAGSLVGMRLRKQAPDL